MFLNSAREHAGSAKRAVIISMLLRNVPFEVALQLSAQVLTVLNPGGSGEAGRETQAQKAAVSCSFFIHIVPLCDVRVIQSAAAPTWAGNVHRF